MANKPIKSKIPIDDAEFEKTQESVDRKTDEWEKEHAEQLKAMGMLWKEYNVPFSINFYRQLNIGLTAVSFAVIVTFMQITFVDLYLHIALVCFAVILPINVYYGFFASVVGRDEVSQMDTTFFNPKVMYGFSVITLAITVFGISAILIHFSVVATLGFVIACIIFIVLNYFGIKSRLDKLMFDFNKLKENLSGLGEKTGDINIIMAEKELDKLEVELNALYDIEVHRRKPKAKKKRTNKDKSN